MQPSKLLISFLAYIIMPCIIKAQTIFVDSIQLLSEDVCLNYTPRYDLNDNECALIIVSIEQQGVQFRGNIVGDVEIKNNKYYIHVPNMTKRINFQHADFLPGIIDFSEKNMKIIGGKVYAVKLSAEATETVFPIVKKQYLIFLLQQPKSSLIVNGEKWEVTNGVAKRKVPLGEYTYMVSLDGYKEKVGTITMNNEMKKEVIKVSLHRVNEP